MGGYVIERALAQGGMGQVFVAADERLQRKVALKVLLRADDEARARFLREARALARVEHPAVVRVHASGEEGEIAWMALDLIAGESLTELCAGAPIDEETAVSLMAQVARGLAAVHAVDVVHRDVKPDNLLVDDDANVKIVDFGVAWFKDGAGGFTTRTGLVVGTPHFMSPEQARGGAVDARSDAWSLGATLWTLLCGRPPFFGRDDEPDLDILARVVRDDVPDLVSLSPSTSSATRALLASLLDKDPAKRPAHLGEVAAVLEAIAADLARGDVPLTTHMAPSTPSTSLSGTAGADSGVAARAAQPAEGEAVPGDVVFPRSSAPAGASALSVPTVVSEVRRRPGVGVTALAAGVGIVTLLVVGVASGVVFGRRSVQPVVQERVVERVVKVEVPVVPSAAAPAAVAAASPVAASPKPHAQALAQSLADTPGPELLAAVDRVLAQNDPTSRAALVLLAGAAGPAGDVVVDHALFDDRVDRGALIDAALRAPGRGRALLVVQQLERRRDDEAFRRLRGIAEEHGDPKVRAAAARARDSIFSAGDEGP